MVDKPFTGGGGSFGGGGSTGDFSPVPVPNVLSTAAQVNNRPFVPNAAPAPAPVVATGANPAINPSSQGLTSDVPYVAPSPATDATLTTLGDVENQALTQVLESTDYQLPNPLSALRNPAYRFRLFMTTEHDLLESGSVNTVADLHAVLDKLPQVTIAQSGVTAGFNIRDVEFEQVCAPGFRNRNAALMGNLKISIIEPLGSSFNEAIVSAGISLGIQNFQKVWYYLELNFIGYNEDGSINQSPLSGLNLDNGGRWIYQLTINNMNVKMDETGSTYGLECTPYSMLAFDDETAGRVPDKINVSGKTIREFCNNFADALTKSYTKRYLGEIYKFKINILPITDDAQNRDPGTFTITPAAIDPQQTNDLDEERAEVSTGNIARGLTISDVITSLYAHTEQAQQMMLDTNIASALEDTSSSAGGDTATYNNKLYRVPILPYIEPDIKITGYDPITGNYTKEITYNVNSFRNYATNLSYNQNDNIKKDPRVVVTIANELKDRGYLKKHYDYRFTGLNTEVIKCDVDFNFAFQAKLPRLTGWAATVDAQSVHKTYNPAANANDGAQSSAAANLNETSNANPGQLTSQQATAATDKLAGDFATAASNLSSAQDSDDAIQNKNDPATNKPYTNDQKKASAAALANAQAAETALQPKITAARVTAAQNAAARRTAIESSGVTNIFAEDAVFGDNGYQMTYIQAHSEALQAAGSVIPGQWHRGASLVGAMLNQLFEPSSEALLNISLQIRGDPYWLGMSNLERRARMNGAPKPSKDTYLPSFVEGDSTLALIFRFPAGIDPKTGNVLIRKDDIFNGLYRVRSVKHHFAGGEFTQTVEAHRLELITAVTSQALSGGTDTAPSTTIPNS
jgi:hypothetical protein